MQSELVSRRAALWAALWLLPGRRFVRAGQWQKVPDQQAAPQPGTPQPRAGEPTFTADVKVVNVFATVRDKDGKIVRDLTKDDFVLEEDGRFQSIRYFAQQSELPLTVGLLIDTSMSELRMIPTERDASAIFFEQVLRPDKDKAFLIHFDREVELLQDLTSSREKLEKALDQLDRPQWSNSDSGQSGGNGGDQGGGGSGRGGYGRGGYGGGRGSHGGTALYDAIYLASDDLMSKQTGRKALILMTDGEDRGSKESLSEAIGSAQRADTLAYSVRIADEERESNRGFGGPGMGGRHGGWGGGGMGGGRGRGGGYENRPDGKKILQQISKQTGGAYFEVSKKKTVAEIYKQIEEELRSQYSLGYKSDQAGAGFRKIQLTVKQKGLTVQTRDGYYAS
jgi:VWFA-related protein